VGKPFTEERKRKISIALTGKRASDETRAKMSKSAKKRKHPPFSEETKTKISNTLRGHVVSKETRGKISKALLGRPLSGETIEKMKGRTGEKASGWRGGKIEVKCKLCGQSRYVVPSVIKSNEHTFCSKRCNGIWAFKHSPKKDTSIERAIEEELAKREIPYLKQCPVEGIALVDFLLPDNTIIQADGDYWHNLPGRKNRDSNQDVLLSFKGYNVFRFEERKIKQSAKRCIDRVLAKVAVNARTFTA